MFMYVAETVDNCGLLRHGCYLGSSDNSVSTTVIRSKIREHTNIPTTG